MQDQYIEEVGRALLIDFMKSNGIEPVVDSFEAIYDGPHVIITLAGKPRGAIVYGKLMKNFERYIAKHNVISSVRFVPYTITIFDDIYISLAQ